MKEYIDRSMTFSSYEKLIDDLLEENKTTGTNQSEAMIGYGRLNRQRMKRLEKTIVLDEAIRDEIAKATRQQTWLILTEGWCGDAAQNLPVIEKIAAENVRIETRYILRDENLGLMDQYLTDGGRSIPKLIALDTHSGEVLWTWGARPKIAQDLYKQLKADGVEKSEILEKMQRWYNDDKGHWLAAEFAELITENDRKVVSAAI